ncbi:MAG: RpiB/LacA/LacB family sugar-phosphate isomerase [Chloroflexota bacterium]
MRIALGSDENTGLTALLEQELAARGHRVCLFGALAPGGDDRWPVVGRAVAEAVASGQADEGIVCCFTGTGVSIAANKVYGVRAALCADAATAAGARRWNRANVLALSLRATSEPLAREILGAWFSEPLGSGQDEELAAIVEKQGPAAGGAR